MRSRDGSRGHDITLSNSTASKVQTQGTIGKESKPEESRLKKAKSAEGKNPAPACSKSFEPEKTSHTAKRKEYLEKKKKKRDRKNNILATGDKTNAVEVNEKKKQDDQGDKRCYNC